MSDPVRTIDAAGLKAALHDAARSRCWMPGRKCPSTPAIC
jgi:hypothetical protein